MLKIPKQEYTTEFRTLAVKRVKDGQNIRDVARELGISHQTLRNWVKAHDAGTLNGPGTKVITPEQMELSRLDSVNYDGRPCCLKKECYPTDCCRFAFFLPLMVCRARSARPLRLSVFPQLKLQPAYRRTCADRPRLVLLRARLATP